MSGLYLGDAPARIYKGDAHPINLYQGEEKLAGWKWDEQSGADMPFEDTYNDQVDVVALGRSKQEQTVQGKNLIDATKLLDPAKYNLPSWYNGGYLALRLSLPNGTYKFRTTWDSGYKETFESTYTGGFVFTVSTYINDSNIYSGPFAHATSPSTNVNIAITLNVTNEEIFISVFPRKPTLTEHMLLDFFTHVKVQIEAGTTATAYEPFTPDSPSPDYPSPIISAAGELGVEGRNLLPNQIVSGAYSGVAVTVNADKSVTLNGTATASLNLTVFKGSLKLPAGTYCPFKENGGMNVRLNDTTNQYSAFALTGADYISLAWYWWPAGTAFNNVTVHPQLELGTTPTPYTPHRPIITHELPELRGIPDDQGGWAARDELYIERVGGEWHLMRRQRVGRKVFDGTEIYQGNYYTEMYAVSMVSPAIGMFACACNRFTGTQSAPPRGDRLGKVMCNPANNALGFGYDNNHTVEGAAAFKAQVAAWYAAGDPLYVDYVLATPIIHDLGPIDLPSYYPYTRVLVEGEYAPDVTARCRVVDN